MSPSWGEAPSQRICTKTCRVIVIPDIITCEKFETEIFRDYDFTGVRIFNFSIDCYMGVSALPVMTVPHTSYFLFHSGSP